MSSNNSIRLQKVIADCGVTSRRKAEDLIVQGRVKVNGVVANVLGTKVNPSSDVIEVDEKLIDIAAVSKVYILMNKPRGYMTTLSDPEGRRTVMELCKDISERIYPVGRLDYLSEGLLILTNDGELANMIGHPRNQIQKVYEVKVFGAVSEQLLKKLRAGVQLDDGFAKPDSVRVIKQLQGKTWIEFRLSEGKNREIRKICEACGITVDKLKRVAIATLSVDGIRPGAFHYSSKSEILKAIGIGKDGRLSSTKQYSSKKRSVNLAKKSILPTTPADDKAFIKFRKEFYFDTIDAIKKSRSLDNKKKFAHINNPRPKKESTL